MYNNKGVVQTPPVPDDLPSFSSAEEIENWRRTRNRNSTADPFANSLDRKLRTANNLLAKQQQQQEEMDAGLFRRVSIFPMSQDDMHSLRKSFISEIMLLIKEHYGHAPPYSAIGAITFVVEEYLRECTVLPSMPMREGERQVVLHYLARFFSRPHRSNNNINNNSSSSVAIARSPPGFHQHQPYDADVQERLHQWQQRRDDTIASEREVLDAFEQVAATTRERLIRLLARYDPGRLFAVDAMLEEAAAQGTVGAQDELLGRMIKDYGPEPKVTAASSSTATMMANPHQEQSALEHQSSSNILHSSDFPTVVLCDPVKTPQMVVFTGTVRSCRVTSSYRWHLLVANEAIALDVFVRIGVANTSVLSHVRDSTDPDKSVTTVRLELLPGSIEPLHSYIVWLTVFDQHGTAKESQAFVAPVFGRDLN